MAKPESVIKTVDMEVIRVDSAPNGNGNQLGKYLYMKAVEPAGKTEGLTPTPSGFLEVFVTEGDLLNVVVGQQVQVQISVKVNA